MPAQVAYTIVLHVIIAIKTFIKARNFKNVPGDGAAEGSV